MKLKVIIVDDEPPVRNELRFILDQIDNAEIVGEAGTGSAAIVLATEKRPDLVFLDIKMPVLSGIEVSKILSDSANPPLVIFSTAYEEYALNAFDAEAFDYILKPFTLERVKKTVNRALRFLQGEGTKQARITHDCIVDKILFYKGDRIIPTPPDQIFFARSDRSGVIVHAADEEYKTKLTLNELEEKLSHCGFVRVHRCSLVNLHHIREMIPWFHGSCKLVMNNKENTEIDVSRYHAKELKKHFR
jgi:two-component system, LytTR family, response regulator LytT